MNKSGAPEPTLSEFVAFFAILDAVLYTLLAILLHRPLFWVSAGLFWFGCVGYAVIAFFERSKR